MSLSLPRAALTAAWPLLAAAAVFPLWGAHQCYKIALMLCIAAWGLAAWFRPGRQFQAGWRWLPFSLSLLTFAAFTAMGMLAVANYSNFDWGDISCYLSSFRNSPGWLPGSNVISGRPLLAHHSEFFCIPAGWIFRLAPGPMIVQCLQAAGIISAWLLFRAWILGKIRDQAAGEWLAFGFALSPCLLTLLAKGFHGVAFAAPMLVLTATAFHDRNWRRFLISLILLLLVKETFTFTAIALAGVALLQRRPLRWVVVPACLGLGYGLFLRYWFFPMMLKDSAYFYGYMLGDWRTVLVRIFAAYSLRYLFYLILWGGTYAALLSPYALLALPPVLVNLAISGSIASPNLHYVMEPAFWIFFAGATTFLDPVPEKETPPGRQRRLVSLLVCMLLMNSITRTGMPVYLHHKYEASFRCALARIPAGTTVSLGASLEDRLWKIKGWRWIHFAGEPWLPYSQDEGCRWGEYALLARRAGMNGALEYAEEERIRVCREALEKDPGYQLIWSDPALELFRKLAR